MLRPYCTNIDRDGIEEFRMRDSVAEPLQRLGQRGGVRVDPPGDAA